MPVDIVVVDYNNDLITPAHLRVTLSHKSTISEIPEREHFDLVLASAVLEHLPEPAEITRKLLGALAPGGFFYARTPYMAAFPRTFTIWGRTFGSTFYLH